MGVVLMVIFSIIAGLVFMLGWHSFGLLCDCTVVTEARVQGVVGLFACAGFVAGGVMQAMWG